MAITALDHTHPSARTGDRASHREPPGRHVPSFVAIGFAVLWMVGGVALWPKSGIFDGPSASDQAAAMTMSSSAPGTTTGSTSAPAPTTVAADIARKATDLPGPISRRTPTTVSYTLTTTELKANLADGTTYSYWTFDNTVPGPFLRVMQGDTVNITIKNSIGSLLPHSIDLHAVSGPGGGSLATQTTAGKVTTFSFKALNPGLYIYHCATAPVA